jgi:hypothetical protein
LKEVAFQSKVSELRRQSTDRTIPQLSAAMVKAVVRPQELMRQGDNLAVVQRSATAILEHGFKPIVLSDLESRLRQLETLS